MSRRNLQVMLPYALALTALSGFIVIHMGYARGRRAEESLRLFINHLNRSELAEAQREIERAVSIDPGNAHYLSNQALLQERKLQLKFVFSRFRNPEFGPAEIELIRNAISSCQRALDLNPNDEFMCHNLGWLYWLAGEKEQAFHFLNRAVSIYSDEPLYHLSLGLLREYSGGASEAFKEYALAVQLSPGILDSRFFTELQQRAPAPTRRIISDSIARFEDQLAVRDDPILQAKLAKFYLLERPDRAAPLLKDASVKLPNLYRTWFNLGYLYELEGNEGEMEKCYRRSIHINRIEVQPLFRLGKYYDRKNLRDQAIRHYRLAVNARLNPPSPHSIRVRRIYISNHAVRDDVIPNGLLQYSSPDLDLLWTYSRLSELLDQTGDNALASRYRKLAEEIRAANHSEF